MSSPLAAIKEASRRSNHEALGVAILWSDGVLTLPAGGADRDVLSARWGNKIVSQGDLGGDYAEILEGLDRIIFQDEQLDALGIQLARGDTIEFPEYGITFELDQPQPRDGPLNVYWSVTRA
jgi:hypothetical protein